MPVKAVPRTNIEHASILDEHGNFDTVLSEDFIGDEGAARLYKRMSVSQRFDQVACKLQRSGQMGTCPENRGQTGVAR